MVCKWMSVGERYAYIVLSKIDAQRVRDTAKRAVNINRMPISIGSNNQRCSRMSLHLYMVLPPSIHETNVNPFLIT